MENIRDWCISRQLWWGHRIPVWYCADCSGMTVARVDPTACQACGSQRIKQDEDVLDTWFSSWLWPFSTMGWPEATPTLQRFYPTDALVTAADIIFFWVARMVMAGYEFMGECPFQDVYLNSIVRDGRGLKMSKSLGNSPDPLDVIDQYGADAMRFTIVSLAPVGQDVRYDVEKTEFGRNFANKIWNATRFALMHLGDDPLEPWGENPPATLGLPDRWILSRADAVAGDVRGAFAAFRLNDAATILYRFIWGELCDWYLELVKPALYGDDAGAKAGVRRTLLTVLDRVMRLLHPFMPFLTEEVWQALPMRRLVASLVIAPYPHPGVWRDADSEEAVGRLIDTVTAIRNIRSELGIAPGTPVPVVRIAADGRVDEVRRLEGFIRALARVASVELLAGEARPSGEPSAVVAGLGEVFVPLQGVDVAAVRERLARDLAKVEKDLKGVEAKLARPDFVERAPEEIVAKERERAASLQERRGVLARHVATLAKQD
jgi:valyl-tRNA synthetase